MWATERRIAGDARVHQVADSAKSGLSLPDSNHKHPDFMSCNHISEQNNNHFIS